LIEGGAKIAPQKAKNTTFSSFPQGRSKEFPSKCQTNQKVSTLATLAAFHHPQIQANDGEERMGSISCAKGFVGKMLATRLGYV